MQPLTPSHSASLRASGEMTNRLSFAKSIGNHRVDEYRLRRAIYRTARRHLQNKGLAQAEIERLLPSPAPPPAWRGMPTTGTVKLFALLIEFTDYPHHNASGTINSALFESPATGFPYESLAAYYLRSSYKKLDLSGGATLGWYQTNKKRSGVAQTTAGRESLIKEALQYFDGQGHNFKQYDNNQDGVVDYFLVFWSGPDNGWANFWWGYQTDFSDGTFKVDGVKLGPYSWQWESNPVGSAFNPRVAIHETGHALGLPDLYDYDGTVGPDGGVGGADMMDANAYDHNCFSKWMLEWLDPVIVSSGKHTVTLGPAATSQDCVAIWPGLDNYEMFTEFFMMENRNKVGNDATFPANGAVIWHIDARLNPSGTSFAYDNSFTDHKLVRLMEADGKQEIEANQGFNVGDLYLPGRTFGSGTTPSSQKYDGGDSGVTIRDITASPTQFSATFEISGLLGSSLEGYSFESQNTQHVIYVGIHGQINELWCDNNGWHANDLIVAAGSPAAPSLDTAIAAYAFEKQYTQHVVYTTTDGHLMELWWDNRGWHANDLSVAAGSPAEPRVDTPLVGYAFEKQNTQHIIYMSTNRHVMELWWDANGWHANDLSVAAGNPAAPGEGTPLVAYAFENQYTQHVMYVTSNHHVMELWWDNNGWHANDLSMAAGTPAACHADTPLVGYAFEKQNTQHVMYLTANQHVMELWCDNNGWHANDLSVAAGNPATPTADTPFIAYAFENQYTQHVMYLAASNHVMELWWNNNGWHANDLTVAAGGPAAPKLDTPLIGYAFENQMSQHVMYMTTDNHVMELWWYNAWHSNDLTAAAGSPVAWHAKELKAVA